MLKLFNKINITKKNYKIKYLNIFKSSYKFFSCNLIFTAIFMHVYVEK